MDVCHFLGKSWTEFACAVVLLSDRGGVAS